MIKIKLDNITDQRKETDQVSKKFRWFMLPSEAYGIIHGDKKLYGPKRLLSPFEPRFYKYHD